MYNDEYDEPFCYEPYETPEELAENLAMEAQLDELESGGMCGLCSLVEGQDVPVAAGQKCPHCGR
jgi:hypothetical protein